MALMASIPLFQGVTEVMELTVQLAELVEMAHTPSISQPESKPSILGRIFYSKEVVPIVKGPRFEDFGDGGTYEGDLVTGLRQGEGKMVNKFVAELAFFCPFVKTLLNCLYTILFFTGI